MVGIIRIDCFPNFKRTIGIVYWVTYFGLVVQDCLEAILHYTEIAFTAESSIEEQLQSIKAVAVYCLIAIIILPLAFRNVQEIYRVCLIQKRFTPQCPHCRQREWKRRNLKRMLDVGHTWLHSM